ncbi:MAG TPA: adenosylmethionine--8-amino-7-oxononanoate transaminase [Gammaproteobacteria bacterium]|nr:adenosylmethionine--8-amino-7-oxononanoate transaminase [Gammaproteobacteria bacterium]
MTAEPAHLASPWQAIDHAHLWHPYTSLPAAVAPLPVVGAEGCELILADGRRLIDAMASWWSAIHGYNQPALNDAAQAQLARMSHVMFGGLTHPAAAGLAERLLRIVPAGLDSIFLADSGSVAVEVAIKAAMQYWQAAGQPQRRRLLAFRHGYHGDTCWAMSVSDPANGMHRLYADMLPQQRFAPAPQCPPDAPFEPAALDPVAALIEQEVDELAGVIIEPLVQGAGGMRFYHPAFLAGLRRLCDAHGLLLICDEIATGFGRTGTLFACEQAGITPDILCLGKALTGGYLTLAATLTTRAVSARLNGGEAGVLMHGPTFMANPLACTIASASIDLLLAGDWQARVRRLETGLRAGLAPAAALPSVREVRVFGAIGVIEMQAPVDMARATAIATAAGVWLRPFGRLIYTMPPYPLTPVQTERVCEAMCAIASGTGG